MDKRTFRIDHQIIRDIRNFLYTYGCHVDLLDDLTQDVLVRMWRFRHTYKQMVDFRTWVFTIAKHIAIDSFRLKRYDRFVEVVDLPEEPKIIDQIAQKDLIDAAREIANGMDRDDIFHKLYNPR